MKYFFLVAAFFIFFSATVSGQSADLPQKVYIIRLHPGDDLRKKVDEFVKQKKIMAGYIITCVGTLKQVTLRLANKNETSIWKDYYEILSLSGTLSPDGNHLHLAAASKEGETIGGHLTEGCIVSTSAEIVIGADPNVIFTRETDSITNLKELRIYPNK